MSPTSPSSRAGRPAPDAQQAAAALRASPLGACLSVPEVESIVRLGVVRRYKRGQVLWREGGVPRGIHLVLEGRVRVVASRGGRQHLVHTSGPGSVMGEVPLLAGGAYPATAITAVPTVCLVWAPDAVEHLLAAHPGFARALLLGLAGRVRILIERLRRHTLGDVRSRVAASLLGQASTSAGLVAEVGTTQAEWAEDLGTVREVLARELSRLKRLGLISPRGRGSYAILDPEGLERLAQGGNTGP